MTSILLGEALLALVATILLYVATQITLALPKEVSVFNEFNNDKKVPLGESKKGSVKSWGLVVLAGLAICLALTTVLIVTPRFSHLAGSSKLLVVILPLIAFSLAWQLRTEKQRIIAVAVMAAVSVAWTWSPNWLTSNLLIIALLIATVILIQLRSSFLQVAVALAIIAFFHDVVQTWGTDKMEESALRAVSNSEPRLFVIPASFDLSAPMLVALGAADIFLPSLLAVIAGRIAERTGHRSIYWAAIAGFAVGLCLSAVGLYVTKKAQPAMIYILPSLLLAVWLTAWRCKVSDLLWKDVAEV